ncbi:MAG TPA: hypothetical protein VIY86_12070, partial [Pirellulaceae bacterium]
MAVQLKCGAVFLHIPKTGGSWVRSVLQEQALVQRQLGHMHADYSRALMPNLPVSIATHGLGAWSKNLLPRWFKALPPLQKMKREAEAVWRRRTPYCFCFVRHPMDWYESWWRYMRQRTDSGWAQLPDFSGWHPCRGLLSTEHPEFNGFMCRVLATRPGFVTELFASYAQPDIDFVGRQERLADDLVHVLRTLNVTFDENRI